MNGIHPDDDICDIADPQLVWTSRNEVKKSGLVLTAGAYDLLNRGSEYSTSATADSYMQKWKPSYGRYYLVNLVYEFYKRH